MIWIHKIKSWTVDGPQEDEVEYSEGTEAAEATEIAAADPFKVSASKEVLRELTVVIQFLSFSPLSPSLSFSSLYFRFPVDEFM